jgi:hypothetical protein
MLSVLMAAGLTVGGSTPALAEFEINEPGVEKGESELEYRGAVHWGVPKGEKGGGGEGDEEEGGEGVLEEEEEGEGLRQSHDFEFEYGLTDRIRGAVTLGTDEPIEGDFDVSGVELEALYELIEREGDGFGLAIGGGYGFATRGGEADEIEFGAALDVESNRLLLTLNPFFVAQVGDNRETSGLGFEYGWRGEYKVARNWGLGVEMFGEIEQLAHTGPFDDQNHSIGPTLFYNPGGDDDDIGGEGDDDDDDEIAGEPEMEFVFNVGLQFGLTDATSDTALKFQGAMEF